MVELLPTPEQTASMIGAVIIDDHVHICALVKSYLERYFPHQINVVGMAHRFQSAVDLLQTTTAEIVFLDIDLNDGNGFDALIQVSAEQRERLQVIIISTEQQRPLMKKALQLGAIDYLDKPLVGIEFETAVKKAIQNIAKVRSITELISTKTPQKRPMPTEQTGIVEVRVITLNQVRSYRFTVAEVAFAEAARNTCTIVLLNGESYISSLPLKHFEPILLDNGCLRISRSYIINPVHVPLRRNPIEMVLQAFLPSGEIVSVEPKYQESVEELL